MSSIDYGKRFLKLKKGETAVKEFLNDYLPIRDNNLILVPEERLGNHLAHEKAHADILSSNNIRHEFYLSEDGKIAATKSNDEDLKKFASNLNLNDFIEFLKELHNPAVEGFVMDGTDKMIYEILNGSLDTDEKIEAYVMNKQ